MLRFLTAGESHGPALTTILEGMPAGMPLVREDIDKHLARRQLGYGRGGRMKIEKDRAHILSGVRGGATLGSPITLQIKNKDWENWQTIMGPDQEIDWESRRVTQPRPGHADLTGVLKYGYTDVRNVLERSSARETAARVAAGSVAAQLLRLLGIKVFSHVVSIGSSKQSSFSPAKDQDLEQLNILSDQNPVRCLDEEAANSMIAAIDQAKSQGDSLGGVFEIAVSGLPPGLGSHVHWDRRLDGRLAGALMGIQAIKCVEIGLGFESARQPGSQVHDPISFAPETGFYRTSNNAGGLEGGMTNGEILVIRAAMKPIPTLYKPLNTIDLTSGETVEASVERSDTCAVPAAAVVGEMAVAWELAKELLETVGGDRFDDVAQWVQLLAERNRIMPWRG